MAPKKWRAFLRQMHRWGPPGAVGKRNAQVGTPHICGTTAAEVGANAKAEAGAWQPSLEGQNGERKEWKFVVTSRTFYGSN